MAPRTSPRKKAAAAAAKVEEKVVEKVSTAAAKGKKAVAKPTTRTKTKAEPAAPASVSKKKSAPPQKRKAVEESEDQENEEDKQECDSHDEPDEPDKKPAPKKRRTKKEKEEDMVPLAPRTAVASLKKAMFIGAHVSGAGGEMPHSHETPLQYTYRPCPFIDLPFSLSTILGVQNSITNATQIGANAFALFLKSQRKWSSPPLDPAARDAFHAAARDHNYAPGLHVLPHGSYLVNLAQADKAKADQAYDNFVDDLRRCDSLGIRLYNFHPGSTGGAPMAEAAARIAAQLNRAHAETESVVTVLENMCGSGNVVGGRFEDLRDIIAAVDDKARVGVCLDTCHTFAAGYDLRGPEAFARTMDEFDRVVGLRYLRALHLNDSKAPLGSHRDLHANIGTGFLGLRAFHNVVNYDGFAGLPLVLETPIDRKGADGKTVEDKTVWAEEIKLLEGLIGADPETEPFREKEVLLSARGEAERTRVQQQVDAKAVKDAKKGAKKGGKKKAASDDEDDDA